MKRFIYDSYPFLACSALLEQMVSAGLLMGQAVGFFTDTLVALEAVGR